MATFLNDVDDKSGALQDDLERSTLEENSTENFHQLVEFQCSSCGVRSYHLKVCGLCGRARYCDAKCQGRDWTEHKKTCGNVDAGCSLAACCQGGSFVEVNQASLENESPEVVFLGLDKCVKNGHNNHAGFIGVQDLELCHLPGVLQRSDILDYIKAEANLTVRLKVKFTSLNRPDTDACAKHRGSRFARTASGLSLLDNPDCFKSKLCTVPNCHRNRDLGPEHSIFEGDLKIFTNKHVIFDEEELAKTTVDFFYDSDDKKGMVQEYATKLFYLNGASDKAFIKVTIHDQDMFKRMEKLDGDRADRFREIPKTVLDNWSPYAILISHPHGMPKKFSIGKIYKITEENGTEESLTNAKTAGDLQRKWFSSFLEEDYLKFMKYIGTQRLPVHKMWYDTPSCPGSSGGQVLFGGTELEGVRGPYVANHNGYDLDSSLNFFKVVKFVE